MNGSCIHTTLYYVSIDLLRRQCCCTIPQTPIHGTAEYCLNAPKVPIGSASAQTWTMALSRWICLMRRMSFSIAMLLFLLGSPQLAQECTGLIPLMRLSFVDFDAQLVTYTHEYACMKACASTRRGVWLYASRCQKIII